MRALDIKRASFLDNQFQQTTHKGLRVHDPRYKCHACYINLL